MVCTDKWRAQTSGGAGAKWCYEGTMVDWGVREVYGFDPPWLGVGDVAKISYFFYIMIHNFITILCHVGFSILQVV